MSREQDTAMYDQPDPSPRLPMPGERFLASTVVASSWMADPNDDGVYIAVVLLLNPQPYFYSVAWIEATSSTWLPTQRDDHANIIDATHQYEEYTR